MLLLLLEHNVLSPTLPVWWWWQPECSEGGLTYLYVQLGTVRQWKNLWRVILLVKMTVKPAFLLHPCNQRHSRYPSDYSSCSSALHPQALTDDQTEQKNNIDTRQKSCSVVHLYEYIRSTQYLRPEEELSGITNMQVLHSDDFLL